MARKETYDPEKVKELRMKLVTLSLDVLNDHKSVEKWSEYKKQLVLRYAGRVLPTLMAGKDDESDLIPERPLLGDYDGSNHSNKENNGADGGDKGG